MHFSHCFRFAFRESCCIPWLPGFALCKWLRVGVGWQQMVLGCRSDQVNVWADRVGLNHCLGGQDERRMRVRGRSRTEPLCTKQRIQSIHKAYIVQPWNRFKDVLCVLDEFLGKLMTSVLSSKARGKSAGVVGFLSFFSF